MAAAASTTCVQCGNEIVFDDQGKAANAFVKNRVRVASKQAQPTYACKSCNRLSNRIYKAQAEDESLKGCMDKLTADDRKEFFVTHCEVLGPELAALLKTTATKSHLLVESEGFNANGDWLDEADLTEKYKSKPQQLESILAKARSFTHPIRGCLLYEDVEFKGQASHVTKRREEVTISAETEETAKKPPKKVKVAKPKEAKGLTDKAKEKATKLLEKIAAQKTSLEEAIATTKDAKYKEYIAPALCKRAEEALLEIVASSATVTLMLEEGWSGKGAEVEKEARQKLEVAKTARTRILKGIDDAAELLT